PKAGHLQTRGGPKIVVLSEDRSPSDKKRPQNSRPVRRQVTFRQGKAQKIVVLSEDSSHAKKGRKNRMVLFLEWGVFLHEQS
ncbi:hypothetical protein COD92_15410, partial [Bacillus sp. AFS037270]